jgi:hypothetical protein
MEEFIHIHTNTHTRTRTYIHIQNSLFYQGSLETGMSSQSPILEVLGFVCPSQCDVINKTTSTCTPPDTTV